MGNVLPYLEKDLQVPTEPGFSMAQHRNAVDIGGILTGGGDLISNIIGYATGTTQQAAAAQQLAAQAAMAQAEAAKIAASQKKQNIALIVGVAVGGLALTAGIIAYFKFRRKKA